MSIATVSTAEGLSTRGEPLVIIGNGMAAARLTQELIACDASRYAITIIGDEPSHAYNRIMLSPVLSGDASPDELPLKPARWWADAGVELISGVAASSVSLEERVVTLANRRSIAFSKLVFATGSRPLRLPLPGAEHPQVYVFRTLQDTEHLVRLGDEKSRVVVIGGGLLGIEAAYGLAKRGARVTLVHLMDRLMERQLDDFASAMVKTSLGRRGIDVLLDAQSECILGDGQRVEGLRLNDGRVVVASAVVMAAGIKPCAELASAAGVAVKRGIVVDSHFETAFEGIYAIGECAEVDGLCCGLVEPVYDHAAVLARRLTGDSSASCKASIPATNLKVSGLPVFSAGNFIGGEGTSAILLRDPGLGLYKKFVTRNGVLEGAVLVGDTSDAAWYLRLIREGASIAAFRSGLAFGESYCSDHTGILSRKAA